MVYNLEGQKFNKLKVIKLLGKDKYNSRLWDCLCDCGNSIAVISSNLIRNKVKSCGCYIKFIFKEKRLPEGEASFNRKYADYKRKAENRNIAFELSKEEFKKFTQQKCHYCGIEPKNICKSERNTGDFIYNGIDRINNKLGYEIENIVPCCKICNMLKKDLDYYIFIAHIKQIVTNFKEHIL